LNLKSQAFNPKVNVMSKISSLVLAGLLVGANALAADTAPATAPGTATATAPAASGASLPAPPAAKPAPTYGSLEEEMASLLGRSSGKT